MPRKSFGTNALIAAIAAATLSSPVFAELYISPVAKHVASASIDAPNVVSGENGKVRLHTREHKDRSGAKRDRTVQPLKRGVVAPVAPLAIPESLSVPAQEAAPVAPPTPPAPKPVMSSGKDVPLKLAIENLVENGSSYALVLDPAANKPKATWKDAESSEAALNQIRSNSGLSIVINKETKRIGVSPRPSIARQLAEPGVQVWSLEAGKSLKTNLADWGKAAGWSVDWSSTQVDYPIDHSATLVGVFEGQNGVVDRLLKATLDREYPLTATFYKGNKVIVVRDAGYKAGDVNLPTIDKQI